MGQYFKKALQIFFLLNTVFFNAWRVPKTNIQSRDILNSELWYFRPKNPPFLLLLVSIRVINSMNYQLNLITKIIVKHVFNFSLNLQIKIHFQSQHYKIF
jgi:hypothetical protein